MMQLFLNNELVDIFGNETIVGSYATNELGDLKTRQGVYSNTFTIPFTNRNRNVMQSAEIVTSLTRRPYQRLHARIDVNGVPVVIGWAVIVSASRSQYEVQVIGGNAEWYNSISDLSLQDLNLDEFNHIFYPTDIDNSRINNTNWTDGYVYANVEYGRTFKPNTTASWQVTRPGMYGKYLLKKILNGAGFEPVGNWWDNNVLLFDPTGIVDSAGNAADKFASFIPFCSLFRRNRDYSLRDSFKANNVTMIPSSLVPPYDYATFNTVISYPSNGWIGIHPNTLLPTVLDQGLYTFNYELDLNVTIGTIGFQLQVFYIDQSGTQTFLNAYPSGIPLAVGNHIVNITMNFNCNPTEFYIIPVYIGAGILTVNDITIELIDAVINDDQDDDYLDISEDFPFVTLNSTLPDVKQVDFLKWYIQKFNLIFTTDNQTGYINFVTLDDVLGNLPNAYNWSKKLDLMQEPVVSFIVGDYGQRSYFKDLRDEENDYTKDNTNYLEGAINIDDENLSAEVTIYETEFSPVFRQSNSYNDTIRLGYVPKYKVLDETLANYDPNDLSNFEELDGEPYMGLLRFEPYHLVPFTGLSTLTEAPAVHGERITWAKIIPEYYQSLQSLLNYSKIVTCLIRLDESDINTLDFTRPVWIDYFGAYFYINKINQFDFTSRQSTEVELIKINYDYDAGEGYGQDVLTNLVWLQNFEFILTENDNFLTLENYE